MTANVDGIAATLARMHMQGAAADVKRYFAEGLQYWPWVLLGYFNIGIMIVSLIGWWALSRLLERMRGIPDVHKLDPPPGDDVDALIGPVPVRLDKVRFRYPRAGQDALREVSLDVRAGEHLAIIGANGSGKTTLMLILAGRARRRAPWIVRARWVWESWAAPLSSCSIRKARSWAPGLPTTWCGGCRWVPPLTLAGC